MNINSLKLFVLAPILLLLYSLSYFVLVSETGYSATHAAPCDPRAEICVTYRILGFRFGHMIFGPLNRLDRRIRPNQWFYVQVLKKEGSNPSTITVADYKRFYYPSRPMISIYSGDIVDDPRKWF